MPYSQDEKADARFRALVEGAPDGIVISRDGVVLYINAAGLRLLGYDHASELVGKPMSAFLDADAIATMRARLMEMRRTGTQPAPLEYEARRRDGSSVTAEITSLFSEHEGAPAVLAFARDVTDRVRMRAQLAHADRLAALGLMAGGVAHEINNPLGYLTLASELLERRLAAMGAPDDVTKLTRDVRDGIERIATIARELRVYARYEEEAPRSVDLAAVVEAAARIAAPELRGRARLRVDVPKRARVRGVATRLEQVIVNLLINAAHASRDDGEVVVRAEERENDVLIEIADRGEGIQPEHVSRIFEPFFTTRSSASGTGLGLSICRDIVERTGGRISAASVLGQGTTITIELPRPGRESSIPPRRADEPSAVAPRARPRVLVIDDEPLIVTSVTRALHPDCDVVGETSARAGLARVLSDPSFDAIVCDLMMPELTGMDLYAEVVRQRPGVEQRFIFITGGSYTPRAREFLDEVPNARVMKPFGARDLLDRILASAAR